MRRKASVTRVPYDWVCAPCDTAHAPQTPVLRLRVAAHTTRYGYHAKTRHPAVCLPCAAAIVRLSESDAKSHP